MRVVTALFAAPSIAPSRLQMPVWYRTNPYVSPGRRNDKRLDACQGLRITNRFAARIDVPKSSAPSLAPYPGLGIGHVAQSGGFGRIGTGGDDAWLIHDSREPGCLNDRMVAPNASLGRQFSGAGEVMLFPAEIAVIFHRALEEFIAPVAELTPMFPQVTHLLLAQRLEVAQDR